MKTAVMLLSTVVLLGGCVSGKPEARTDSADSSFGVPTLKQADCWREIQRMYPNLSEKQIAERVRHEFPSVTPAFHRENERRVAQRSSEDEVAANRRMYDRAEP